MNRYNRHLTRPYWDYEDCDQPITNPDDGEVLQKFDGKWLAAQTPFNESFYGGSITPATVFWEPEL